MKDPAQCVRELLNVSPINTTPWVVNVGPLPDVPDTVILCNHSGGLSPFPNLLLNQPSVQVMVRGARNGYQAARDKIGDCVDVLLGMNRTTVQGDVYAGCTQVGDISFLGMDDNTRPLFSANFSLIVEPASNALTHRVPIT